MRREREKTQCTGKERESVLKVARRKVEEEEEEKKCAREIRAAARARCSLSDKITRHARLFAAAAEEEEEEEFLYEIKR